MKNLLIAACVLCSASFASAQTNSISQSGCATVTSPEELQEIYDFVQRPAQAHKTTAVDTVPLTIHIVGKTDGTGYYGLNNLFTVLCQLNDHYAPANFYFTVKWPINYINNSSYYEHDSRDGNAMMRQNNKPNSVNVYFVQDPAGACGYYSYGGRALAIKKSCALPKSTTLVHELGHYFGLPHTFSGWEGRDFNSPPANPELVTRGAGSNCATRGDGFCDTPADFLSDRWACPFYGNQTDANGDPYEPDERLYMSYASDQCTERFSPQQIAFMQNRLHTTYSSYLAGPVPSFVPFAKPEILYPEDKIFSNYRKVIWNKVPGAESYFVKVKSGAFTPLEIVTTDTAVDIDGTLYENRPYTITVIPMNGVNICGDVTTENVATYTNETTTLSVLNFAANQDMMMRPNPANTEVRISLSGFAKGSYALSLTSLDGKSVYRQTLQHNSGNNVFTIPVRDLPAGMYFLRLAGEGTNTTQKLMVQH